MNSSPESRPTSADEYKLKGGSHRRRTHLPHSREKKKKKKIQQMIIAAVVLGIFAVGFALMMKGCAHRVDPPDTVRQAT